MSQRTISGTVGTSVSLRRFAYVRGLLALQGCKILRRHVKTLLADIQPLLITDREKEVMVVCWAVALDTNERYRELAQLVLMSDKMFDSGSRPRGKYRADSIQHEWFVAFDAIGSKHSRYPRIFFG